MPCIQGKHYGRAALIDVAIIDAARHREHKQSQRPVLAGVKPYTALIDTGATSTMITTKVVQELKLEPVSSLPFYGLDGLTWKMGYLFHVAFYDVLDWAGLNLDDGDQHVVELANPLNRLHVCTTAITGGEISRGQSFDVLLGMDIISTGDLYFRKSGDWQFSF